MPTEAIRGTWELLGLDVVADEAFFQHVLAPLVKPTSKPDSIRVLEELGLSLTHRNTFNKALNRYATKSYRALAQEACFQSAWASHTGNVSLLPYTTSKPTPNGPPARSSANYSPYTTPPSASQTNTSSPNQPSPTKPQEYSDA